MECRCSIKNKTKREKLKEMVCRRAQTKGSEVGRTSSLNRYEILASCNASFDEHMKSYDFARNFLGIGLSVIEQTIKASMVDLF